jgi:undecaprenyl-diphosphatase
VSTAVGPLWAELRRRFREGSAAVGYDAWRGWVLTLAAGVIGMLLLMVVLMRVAQHLLAAGMLDWETGFLLWLGTDGPFRFADAVFFQTFGTDITLVILLTSTAGIAVWARRPMTALSIVIAPLGVDLIGRVGWLMWDRARPDVLWEGIASPGFHSFPSGHTSKTFAAYGFLAMLWIIASRSLLERAIALLMFTFIIVVVPLGRMTIGVHWPSDVLAGYVLGLVWVAVLAWALRYEHRALLGYTARSRTGEPPDSAATVAR